MPLYPPSFEGAIDYATAAYDDLNRRRGDFIRSTRRPAQYGGIPGLAGENASEAYVDVPAAISSLIPSPPPGGYTTEQYTGAAAAAPAVSPERQAELNRQAAEAQAARAAAATPPAKPEAKTGAGLDYHERVKAVKMPDGRIVFTNVPQPGANQVDYGEAMEEVTGRPYRGGVNF